MTEPQLTQTPCSSCDEYLAGWKRAQADYANLKRESERARVECLQYANERLLLSLLPAIDQFETALAHVPQSTDASWLAGLMAVKQIWDGAFRSIGLVRISTDEPFDPAVHEAIGGESVEGKKEGEISRVVETGWKLHEKLLRPAKVMLATQESSETQQDNSF